MQEDQKDGCPCWFFQNTHHYVLVFVLSKTPITICLYLYCPKHPSLCRICVFVNTLFTIHLHLYFPKHTSQQYFSSVCLTINYSSKLLSSHRSFQVIRSLRLYYVPIGIRYKSNECEKRHLNPLEMADLPTRQTTDKTQKYSPGTFANYFLRLNNYCFC